MCSRRYRLLGFSVRRRSRLLIPLALALLVAGTTWIAFPLRAAPGGPISAAPGIATVELQSPANATTISAAYWGVNVAAAQPFGLSDARAVVATPVNYLVYPSGVLAEELNYTSGVLTAPNGTSTPAATTVAQFVTACESMHCRAILGLPTEINSPATAADYANYVVHTLGFQPAYWQIGNAPASWTHFNVPWSEWPTTGGGNTTPQPFADIVHTYIAAIRSVDPTGLFLALGAETGPPQYDRAWISALVATDGLELSGISVHSYVLGGPSSPTDAQLFAELHGAYSLPAQVLADRSDIVRACACQNLPLFVTEANGAELSDFMPLLSTFAGTLYLAAEVTQGLGLSLTNLDWFSYDSAYPGSWSTSPGVWQSQYYLFSDLLPLLGNQSLPLNGTGPPTFFTAATLGSGGLALLLVNVNTTAPVQVALGGPEFAGVAIAHEYYWDGASRQPVESTAPWTGNLTLGPESLALLLVNPGAGPMNLSSAWP